MQRHVLRNLKLTIPVVAALIGVAIWAAAPTSGKSARGADKRSATGASTGLLSYLATAGGATAPPAVAADEALRQLAQRLPADFQADVLLRLAAAPDARDAPGLILQAYRLAPQAARPLPGLAARGWASDDDVLPRQTAGLDQLSLQIRAVRAMLAVAPDRIGTLSSPFPGPRAADCNADYVDNPSAVYELASAVLPANPGARVAFALQVIGRAKTEMDLVPAIEFVTTLPPLTPGGELLVARGLSALFARAQGNDAGFAATGLALASGMDSLLARYNSVPLARRELEGAFHDYVVTHRAATRCPASLDTEYQQLEHRFVAKDDAEAPAAIIAESEPGAAPAPVTIAVEAIRRAGHVTMERLQAGRGDALPSDSPPSDNLLATLDSPEMLAAAAGDASGQIQRTAMYEVLRYLEYAPPGQERETAFGQLEIWLSNGNLAQHHDRRLGDLRAFADSVRRWPDGGNRLRQLVANRDTVVSVYAQLMLSKQFP